MAVALSDETLKKCEEIITHYPQEWRKAAILPVLHLAQKEWGYISLEGLRYVANMLDIPPAHAAGVMSFYPMFHKAPVGEVVIHVCGTLSCALCGAGELTKHLKEKLKIDVGETTGDGRFTLAKVECIAACEGAPAVLINEELHRCVTREKLDELLDRTA